MKTNIHNNLRSLGSGPEEKKNLKNHSNVANAVYTTEVWEGG